jgi:oligopeptide transport system substrate-binding protein
MWHVIFFLMFLLSGCQQTAPKPDQTIRINLGADPLTLDPRKARDVRTLTLMHMLYEGLTRVSKNGEIELGLAAKVSVSEDQLKYVFSLRNSFWSNGEPVTSFDFANAWQAVLDPKFPSDMAYQLYVLKNGRNVKTGVVGMDQLGVKTPDPQTLVVELEQPVPYFLELLSTATFFPYKENEINGPFILKSWARGDQIILEKNSKYWEADAVKVDHMELFMVSNDTEMRMFEEGQLDWAGSPLSRIPPDAIAELKKSEKLCVSPFAATYFLRVNTQKIEDQNLRKALSFAIDRQSIVEHILQGGQKPATGLVPPEMGLSETGYFKDHDLERARALFGKCDRKITLSYLSNEWSRTLAQSLQKQWEEGLGIIVELEAVEPKIYFRRIAQKDYQIALCDWTADFNDPINFLEVFKYKDASTNNTGWEDPEYIALLDRSSMAKTLEERKEALRAAERLLMEQMPIIPVYHLAMNFLQGEGLEQVALSPLGQIDFRWTFKDKR